MTPNFRELDPSKTGKYVRWMEKNYKTDNDLDRLKNVVSTFDKVGRTLKVRDIYQWKLDDLENELLVRPVSISKLSKSQKIAETSQFMLIRVDNLAAAKTYGSGTKWCISSKKDNKFHDYLLGGDMFYILIDRENQTKVCFQLEDLWSGKAKWSAHKLHHQMRRLKSIRDEATTWSDTNHIITHGPTFGYGKHSLHLGQWLECAAKDGLRLRNEGTHPSPMFALKEFDRIKSKSIEAITSSLLNHSGCNDEDMSEYFLINFHDKWSVAYKLLVGLYNAGRLSAVQKIILKFVDRGEVENIASMIGQIADNKTNIANYKEVILAIVNAL